MSEDRDYDEFFDEKSEPEPTRLGDSAGYRLLIPVGRSPWAIAAGYLGLFSVLLIPAPLALVTGIIAVVHIRRNPKMHGMGRAIFGIFMGAVFSVGLLLWALSEA